jgi:hypothetical protein
MNDRKGELLMKRIVFPLACLLLYATVVADSSDDTLSYYMSKSELVVVGKIASAPEGVYSEEGVPNYICDFEISEVLKGQPPRTAKIYVSIIRFEADDEDKNPLVRQGATCILFLKPVTQDRRAWETVDMWFGIQSYYPWMARSLKRLADSETADVSDSPDMSSVLKVTKDKENIVASRLAGKWKAHLPLTRRLTGSANPVGAESPAGSVSFTIDDSVAAKIPAMYAEFFMDKTIYMAGTMNFRGKKHTLEAVFILIEHKGNPHIAHFSERDGDPMGNAESFNVMLTAAKDPKNDLLFIGGDFHTTPFSAFERE